MNNLTVLRTTMVAEPSHVISDALLARLHAILGSGGGVGRLESLHGEARLRLGADHEVTLEIRCRLNRCLGPYRSVDESLTGWADLLDRARHALPEQHPTLMAVRSQYAACLGRRGLPGDLDQSVELRHDELRRRALGGADVDWVGAARADLATALLKRSRYGPLDPCVKEGDPDADAAAARDLIDREADRRVLIHGPDHPFTWHARGVRCGVLLALSQHGPAPQRRAAGAEALALADALVQHEWLRSRAHTPRALRAQLLRAEALSALDRDLEAEREARLAAVLARRYRGPEDGNALLVLARGLATRDRSSARAAAVQALAARQAWYSPVSYQIAEAEQLIDALSEESTRDYLGVAP